MSNIAIDVAGAFVVILLLALWARYLQDQARKNQPPAHDFVEGDSVHVAEHKEDGIICDIDREGRIWVMFEDGEDEWFYATDLARVDRAVPA